MLKAIEEKPKYFSVEINGIVISATGSKPASKETAIPMLADAAAITIEKIMMNAVLDIYSTEIIKDRLLTAVRQLRHYHA